MDNVRKLVRIVTINEIRPADNADSLELAIVGGWQIVVRKDTFSAGDKAVFAEIDSAIPAFDPRFDLNENLIKRAKNMDVPRVVIKTIKLRGNLSQGILFPLDNFPELADKNVGDNVTEELNIVKWETPLPPDPNIIGVFPARFAVKSDSERIQNLTEFWDDITGHEWVCTEKVDGTSTTVINDNGTLRVAGRNWELKVEGHPVFRAISEQEFLTHLEPGMCVQGELIGESIQGNKLKLNGVDFKVFNVFVDGVVVPRSQWDKWFVDHAAPVLDIKLEGSVEDMINRVDGMKSTINPKVNAEGVVFHEKNGEILEFLNRPNFKIINNKFLLKNSE